MKKPVNNNFESFADAFQSASRRAGKPKQYIVPYYIASHPGSDLHTMIDLALFLNATATAPTRSRTSSRPPFDIATCMYYTGIDPFTKEAVYVANHLRDRKLQRALLQFFKPENYFEVRRALEEAGRTDLIGGGCDALIPLMRRFSPASLFGKPAHPASTPFARVGNVWCGRVIGRRLRASIASFGA